MGAASKVGVPQRQAWRGGVAKRVTPGGRGAEPDGVRRQGKSGKGSHAGAVGHRGHSHLRMIRPLGRNRAENARSSPASSTLC